MRILAIVIIYNPERNLLKKNITSFYKYVEHVLVLDNSPLVVKDENVKFLDSLFPEIHVLGDGINHGISFGLNYAWKYAKDNNFDTILSMDQDSVFTCFSDYKQHVGNKWKKEGLSLCGPTPNLFEKKVTDNDFERVDDLITSGMLVPVKLLDISGGYCDDFVLDGIDVDLCVKLEMKNYHSYRDNHSNLSQRFGTPKCISIFGKRIYGSGYSASRFYGIFRNHIIIWRRYHSKAVMKKILVQYLLKFVLMGIIFVDDNKKSKLYAVYKGIKDGSKFKIQ